MWVGGQYRVRDRRVQLSQFEPLVGQSPSQTTIFRHYRPPGSERLDIKNGTVPSNSSLTTKIFPLLRLS
jgi:hypothetical protein